VENFALPINTAASFFVACLCLRLCLSLGLLRLGLLLLVLVLPSTFSNRPFQDLEDLLVFDFVGGLEFGDIRLLGCSQDCKTVLGDG